MWRTVPNLKEFFKVSHIEANGILSYWMENRKWKDKKTDISGSTGSTGSTGGK